MATHDRQELDRTLVDLLRAKSRDRRAVLSDSASHAPLFGIPIEFLLFLSVLAIGQFVLSWTVFGRNLFLIGSGLPAADAAGLRPWRTVTGAYCWAGLFTSVAGIMLGVRYNQANMEFGVGYDYDAIAAVLVGGTAIQGGQGSMVRTLSGVAVISIVQVVLLLYGFRQEWQYLIAGLIVLLVVMLHAAGAKRRGGENELGKDWRSAVPPLPVSGGHHHLLAVLDWDGGRFLSRATAFSTMQSFATLGPVTLGLGLTMLIREFDLSVAGMFGLAGCIAVLTGIEHAWLGLVLAVLAGCGFGVTQGVIMTALNIGNVRFRA